MAKPHAHVLEPSASDLVSAALRHVRDAHHLGDPANPSASLDQAYHLAGLGPECARKAVLMRRDFDKLIGHGFDDHVLELALALDPLAHRYAPRDWKNRYPALSAWNITCRYDRSHSYDASRVRPLLEQAREAVDGVVLALWADGRLPSDQRSGSW